MAERIAQQPDFRSDQEKNKEEFKIISDAEVRDELRLAAENFVQQAHDGSYDVWIFLDKGARPWKELLLATWQRLFPDEQHPEIKYINIGREKWYKFNSEKEKERLTKKLSGVYASGENSSYLDGKNVLIIDEVISSGVSTTMSQEMLAAAYPQATFSIGAITTKKKGYADVAAKESGIFGATPFLSERLHRFSETEPKLPDIQGKDDENFLVIPAMTAWELYIDLVQIAQSFNNREYKQGVSERELRGIFNSELVKLRVSEGRDLRSAANEIIVRLAGKYFIKEEKKARDVVDKKNWDYKSVVVGYQQFRDFCREMKRVGS